MKRLAIKYLMLEIVLVLSVPASAAVPVAYSDFGPGDTFNPAPDGWCVSGATALQCTSLHLRLIAAPIVPQGNLTISQVVLALNWVTGVNSATLTLVNDAGGLPGSTVLETWNLTTLPNWQTPGVVTVNSVGTVTLTAGTRYWLVAAAADTSTMLVWFTNPLGDNGGATIIDNSPWTPLSPLPPQFGGDSMPAFAVIGTQAAGSAGCSGSNPQVCPPTPPPASPASMLYGSGNPATSTPPNCQSGDPVNCATGNKTETIVDLSVPGRGRALAWSRTYNSQAAASAAAPGPLGFGWSDSYHESLASDGSGNEIVTFYNGSQIAFSKSGSSYTAPPFVNATLKKNGDGAFTLTFKNARADTFSASGQLIQQTDRHGYITTLTYDALGNLTSIIDPAGRDLDVTTSNGLVTQVRDPLGRTVRYAYDASHNLISCTDVAGHTWQAERGAVAAGRAALLAHGQAAALVDAYKPGVLSKAEYDAKRAALLGRPLLRCRSRTGAAIHGVRAGGARIGRATGIQLCRARTGRATGIRLCRARDGRASGIQLCRARDGRAVRRLPASCSGASRARARLHAGASAIG